MLTRSPKGIPETAAVYGLFIDGACEYVGQTGNLRRRWSAHELRKHFVDRGFIRWMEVSLPEDRLLVETAFIRSIQPRLNTHKRKHADSRVRLMAVRISRSLRSELKEAAHARWKKTGADITHGELLVEAWKVAKGARA